eukprot:CAMPEP_0114290112 /NCGR_PEP_ID=MMETSP0059-20121206/7750_1 /TAXON_ID=36894 /ORGANISM="Pyramimonas parkeae, Strain CCMP726" /LENGTH=63 /DNA_ID=CAMNT_0001411463 /DNA_START=160 /DNA_END=351 /DNA_ORIENTATION=-
MTACMAQRSSEYCPPAATDSSNQMLNSTLNYGPSPMDFLDRLRGCFNGVVSGGSSSSLQQYAF